jgi:hypothetical protein
LGIDVWWQEKHGVEKAGEQRERSSQAEPNGRWMTLRVCHCLRTLRVLRKQVNSG